MTVKYKNHPVIGLHNPNPLQGVAHAALNDAQDNLEVCKSISPDFIF